MVKERNVHIDPIPDFSNLAHFPGEYGNLFDTILHGLERLDSIPNWVFPTILLMIAALGSWLRPLSGFILFLFFLIDWAIITALPGTRHSFGPVKPQVLQLAILRALVGWMPVTPVLVLQLIGTGLVIYGFWMEPVNLKIRTEILHTPKWISSRPLRIIHLSDLHMERFGTREANILSQITAARPDIILFTGDILNLSYRHDRKAWADARNFFHQLNAPLGVFAVTGSPAVDLPEILPELTRGLSTRWLRNECCRIETVDGVLDLIGVDCSQRPHIDSPILNNLVQSQNLSILLYHSPDLAPQAAQAGIDLHLAGHTHGGQVCLPYLGALFTGSLYGKKFEAGRYRLGNMVLNISRGLGLEGAGAPRVRFLCPPEIILWEIRSPEASATD